MGEKSVLIAGGAGPAQLLLPITITCYLTFVDNV